MTMDNYKNTLWRAYRIMDEIDLRKALDRFRVQMNCDPSRAMISTRCPAEIAEMMRKRLAELGIEPETSNYPLPNDLWLTDRKAEPEAKAIQMNLFQRE